MYHFKKEDLKDYKKNNGICYSMSNGVGGYTSGSVIGSFNRKHYGYLIASLKAPVSRMMILGKIVEKIGSVSLECQAYKDYVTDHHEYLEEFTYDEYPVFSYKVNGVSMKKSIAPYYSHNTVGILYEIESDIDTTVTLTPWFNFRDHGDVSLKESLKFEEKNDKNLYTLKPLPDKKETIFFSYSDGTLIENEEKYTDEIYAQYDQETGDKRYDIFYTPVSIQISVKKNEKKMVSIICSIEDNKDISAEEIIKSYKERIDMLREKSGLSDPLALNLVQASDAFITARKSTGLKTILAGLPWFTDWGRDTMIAFTGLTLVTKRFDEAKEILKSFALYEKEGLIPNMFPDDGGNPWYNTVDASLWYFYACYKYIEYTGDKKFIMDEIYPHLKNIIHAYSTHTENNIHMDEDFLVACGDKDTQITWMDVKTHGIAVTPRFGKPVEINALWYNALCIMEALEEDKTEKEKYHALSQKVKKSFNERYYCKETGCLYDTVDPDDAKIRPNQVWVLSLPFKVLEEKYEKSVFDVITRDLYNVYGLRSLSFKDPGFKPKYEGDLLTRDFAYHMGTTWGFLIGGYFDAYAYINRNDPHMKEKLKDLSYRFMPHLNDGCLYGIAEIFDGDVASRTRGCYNQAWSIGELLRSYYENVLR